MQRSHSRHTYPADKMLPVEEVKAIRAGKNARERKDEKKFHTKKSRGWLKRLTRWLVDNE